MDCEILINVRIHDEKLLREKAYFKSLREGVKPETAAEVLDDTKFPVVKVFGMMLLDMMENSRAFGCSIERLTV